MEAFTETQLHARHSVLHLTLTQQKSSEIVPMRPGCARLPPTPTAARLSAAFP